MVFVGSMKMPPNPSTHISILNGPCFHATAPVKLSSCSGINCVTYHSHRRITMWRTYEGRKVGPQTGFSSQEPQEANNKNP